MHQPYHGHPLLPPWQVIDDNARERSPAMPLDILWEHPDIVEVRVRQWERQQAAAHDHLVSQVRSHTLGKRTPLLQVLRQVWWGWLQRLRHCYRPILPVASASSYRHSGYPSRAG
jgi:hypothetical protein